MLLVFTDQHCYQLHGVTIKVSIFNQAGTFYNKNLNYFLNLLVNTEHLEAEESDIFLRW